LQKFVGFLASIIEVSIEKDRKPNKLLVDEDFWNGVVKRDGVLLSLDGRCHTVGPESPFSQETPSGANLTAESRPNQGSSAHLVILLICSQTR
jgi:hypothetical protein